MNISSFVVEHRVSHGVERQLNFSRILVAATTSFPVATAIEPSGHGKHVWLTLSLQLQERKMKRKETAVRR
ncbi:hypothetical protein K0M31_009550 [Melipona bicolor]|uniref:Uncharacterized protein n=1 Tax=Melipona bicolor TaxID=60889 RepID=A0AA40KJ46_9HYME|nr:hypothetical protein K0M31_009550 [Melipona bicolor]